MKKIFALSVIFLAAVSAVPVHANDSYPQTMSTTQAAIQTCYDRQARLVAYYSRENRALKRQLLAYRQQAMQRGNQQAAASSVSRPLQGTAEPAYGNAARIQDFDSN